jgi:hypothetical protein
MATKQGIEVEINLHDPHLPGYQWDTRSGNADV